MLNAKSEFLDHVGAKSVKCVLIKYGYFGVPEVFKLKLEHTPKQYEDFLNQIDFFYDNGYGGQEIEGIIWYEDGTYSERGEYDGSEWWKYNKSPEIPKDLM